MNSVDAGLERLVLAYLDKRGLTQTSRQLRTEVPNLSRPMTLAPGRDSNGVASELLFYLAVDGQASRFATSFDKLAAWVDNSLDAYKLELQQILYIVFTHCYLYLVKNDANSDATQLFSRHSHRFTSLEGQSFKIRMQELNELQAVTLPEHLLSNRLATAVRSKRTTISLSTYSHELLLNFLQASKLILLLGIINDHLKLEVSDRAPLSGTDQTKETSLLVDAMDTEISAALLSEVNLNLLKNLAEDKVANERAAQNAEEVQADEVDSNGKPLTKKARLARQRAADKEVEAVIAATENRMTAEIPLPVLSEEASKRQMEDIKARATLTSDALPSAAFLTFKSNLKSLSCCTVSSDCTVTAGGFEDASIVAFDLRKQWHKDGDKTTDLADEGRTVLIGHTGAVYGIDLAGDNQLVLSASADCTLRLWHLELGACLNLYRGHNFPVWDVKAGPFGHYFASGGGDRTCRVWSVERNFPVRVLAGHHSDVETVAWHPNSHYLATGSSDTSVRIWDVRDGTCQRVFSGHRAPITALSFHPEGAQLTSADEDGQLLVWDIAEAKQVASLEGHSQAVWSLTYSCGNGSMLASGSADQTVCLWEPSTASATSSVLKPRQRLTTRAAALFTRFSSRNLLMCVGEQVYRSN